MNNLMKYICYSLTGVLLFIVFLLLMQPKELKTVPKLSKIEQRVTILDNDKKTILESHWLIENEDDLRTGKLTFDDCPYTEDKTVYKLKSSMDSITTFFYGSQIEIEKQKCIEFKKLTKIRNSLQKLNKENNCK